MAKGVSNVVVVRALIDNSIALQKVLTDLAIGMKSLSEEMSQLLAVFKEASKSISDEKTSNAIHENELKSIDEKVDHLIDQNKTIAKGLVLMESAMSESLEKKSI